MLIQKGDNAEGFFQLGKSLNLPETLVISVRGPHVVPYVSEEVKSSYMWTPELEFDGAGNIAEDGDFDVARRYMARLIEVILKRGILANRIIFFGLGQGAMLATDLASAHQCHVIAIGATLPKICTTTKGCNALVCGGAIQSKISADSLSRMKKHFQNVSILKWTKQVGDHLPSASKRNSWYPILSFLSKNIVQMSGIPEGAEQIL